MGIEDAIDTLASKSFSLSETSVFEVPLGLKYVRAKMYKMLNKIVNAIMAPMESQKPPSVVKSPFDLRRALPTVGASIEVSVFGVAHLLARNSLTDIAF
jgi:hypothetical protein